MARTDLDVEEELTLRLAQARAGRDRDAATIADLARRVDGDRLWAYLQRQRVTTLLGSRLIEMAPVSARFSERVAAGVEAARGLGTAQAIALEGILAVLAEAGIRAVPLKGPRFALSVYGDLGQRVSGDLDVLVDVDQLDDAVRCVQQLGWGVPRDPRDRRGRPLLHFALRHDGGLPLLELHWRVHWYDETFARDALRRSTEAPGGRALQPADELAFLLLFAARDAFSSLRLPLDIIAWLDRHGHEAWSLMPPVRAAYPVLERVLTFAEGQVRRMADLERARTAPSGPHPVARALVDPLLRLPEKQRQAERGLFDILMAPRDQVLSCVRRQVFPSREVLHFRAASTGEGAQWTGQHAARTVRRYLLFPAVRRRVTTRPRIPRAQ